jgi:hypothetical protein
MFKRKYDVSVSFFCDCRNAGVFQVVAHQSGSIQHYISRVVVSQRSNLNCFFFFFFFFFVNSIDCVVDKDSNEDITNNVLQKKNVNLVNDDGYSCFAFVFVFRLE